MIPLGIVGRPQVIINLKNEGNSVTFTGPGTGEKEEEMIILFQTMTVVDSLCSSVCVTTMSLYDPTWLRILTGAA